MPTEPNLVPLDAILEARARIASRVHRTPMLTSETGARVAAAAGIVVGDGRLYLKAEHLQKTGSFKARGITNKMLSLTEEEHAAGIVTFSAGNAAQAFAWAAREAGVNAVVVMPAGAVRSKVDAALGYGAEVVLHGVDAGEAFAEMERLREARGLVFCHPFDDPAVIAGHGSVGLEILEDVPDVDVVVVGVGGGGLIAGIATAVKERRPSARVYGVEPETSNALSLGIAAGEPVRITPRSVADGLNAPFAGEWTIAIGRRYVDDIVLLDDPTILAGLRFGLERLKQVLEPAGAAALAAVLFGKVPIRTGERVVVILSGGNVDVTRIGELIAAAAPLPSGAESQSSVVAIGALAPSGPLAPSAPPAEPGSADAGAQAGDIRSATAAVAVTAARESAVARGPTVESNAASFALPNARALVAAGFELLRVAQPELRRASLYFGLLTLLVTGPAAVFAIYLATRDPGALGAFIGLGAPGEIGELTSGATIVVLLVFLVLPAVIAISIDAANIGIALLAARHSGRPLKLEEALRRSRQSFWRIVIASALLGIVPIIVLTAGESWITSIVGSSADASANSRPPKPNSITTDPAVASATPKVSCRWVAMNANAP